MTVGYVVNMCYQIVEIIVLSFYFLFDMEKCETRRISTCFSPTLRSPRRCAVQFLRSCGDIGILIKSYQQSDRQIFLIGNLKDSLFDFHIDNLIDNVIDYFVDDLIKKSF